MRDIEMRLIFMPIIILTATIVSADAFPIQQALNNQTKSSSTKQRQAVIATKAIENAYFDFLEGLHAEKQMKGRKLVGRVGLTSKGLSSYKIKADNSYLTSDSPRACSGQVHMFLIESDIG